MVSTNNFIGQVDSAVNQGIGSTSVSNQETEQSRLVRKNAKTSNQIRREHLIGPSSSSKELISEVSLNPSSETSRKAEVVSQRIALGKKDKEMRGDNDRNFHTQANLEIEREDSSQIQTDIDPIDIDIDTFNSYDDSILDEEDIPMEIQVTEVLSEANPSPVADSPQQLDPAHDVSVAPPIPPKPVVPAVGPGPAAPAVPKKPIQGANVINAIQEAAARQDDKNLSVQARLFNIMKDIKDKYDIDPDSLEVTFDLNNDQGKFKLDTFALADQTCYKIDSTFTIKFKDRTSPTTGSVTLDASIFTNSTNPNQALASAKFFSSGCINLALNILDPTAPLPGAPPSYKNGFKNDSAFQTDKQALLNQKSLGIHFKRDSEGNFLTVDKLRSGNITLEFEPKKPFRLSEVTNLDHIFANKERDPIFDASFSIHSDFVSSSYLKSMQEKLKAITDKSKEIKEKIEISYSGYNILKRKKAEKIATQEFQQLLAGLTLIDPKKSASLEKKKAEKDLESIEKCEQKAKDIQDRIQADQIKFGDRDFVRRLKLKYSILERQGRISVIDGYLSQVNRRIEDLKDFLNMGGTAEQKAKIAKELDVYNSLATQANATKTRIESNQITTKDKVFLDRMKKDYPELESKENQSIITGYLEQLEKRKIKQTTILSKEVPTDKQVRQDVINANKQLVNDYNRLNSITKELIAYRSAIDSQNMSPTSAKDAEIDELKGKLTALIEDNQRVIQFFKNQIEDTAAFFNAKHLKSPNNDANNPNGNSSLGNGPVGGNSADNSGDPVRVGIDAASVNPSNPVQSLPSRQESKPLQDVNIPDNQIDTDDSLLNKQAGIASSSPIFQEEYLGVPAFDDDDTEI